MTKKNVVYSVRKGGPIKEKDGVAIAKELQRLIAAQGGMLSPKELIEAARNPRSRLHKYIEWDDAVAAAKYRLVQARAIIRCIQYKVKTGKTVVDVPAFMHVINRGTLPKATPGYGYTSTPTAVAEIDFEQQVLANALKDLRSFTERYKRYQEVFSTLRPIFEAIAKVEKMARRKTAKKAQVA